MCSTRKSVCFDSHTSNAQLYYNPKLEFIMITDQVPKRRMTILFVIFSFHKNIIILFVFYGLSPMVIFSVNVF